MNSTPRRNRVLLTVSGVISDDLGESIRLGRRPRVDYIEMASAFGADLLDYSLSSHTHGRGGRIVERLFGRNVALAWRCFRSSRSYDVIVTDGEQVGLPLAALLAFVSRRGRGRHLMIVHVLSVPKKVLLFKALRLGRRIDEMLVYATAQRDFIVARLGYPTDQVVITSFMVDTAFFSPSAVERPTATPASFTICSAGLEFRDYATLVGATRDLDVEVVLAAASPWSKRRSELDAVQLPANVRIVCLDQHDLRALYAASSLVVMPLHETDFQAGVTTLLEAMAMSKPIICSRTAGQTDVVVDGETGQYVPVGDVDAMRAAIVSLRSNPEGASRLGAQARRWVVATADIDVYVERLARRVEHHLADTRRGP